MDLTLTLSRFVKDLETKKRSRFTITAYHKDLEQLATFLEKAGVREWNDARPEILEKFFKTLEQEHDLTLKTISRKINSTKTFFKFLVATKLIEENYALSIKHPKIQLPIPRVLSPLEYKALRDTARSNVRLYTMIEMLLQTGMRIGELSRLRKEDLGKELASIYIQAYSSYPDREVEVNPVLQIALKNYLNNKLIKSGKSKFVFFTRTGNQILIRNIRSAIQTAFKTTGIKDASVNDLRNTFIIHQLEHGLKIEKLARIVGHKKQSTTEHYLDFIESRPQKTHNTIKAL